MYCIHTSTCTCMPDSKYKSVVFPGFGATLGTLPHARCVLCFYGAFPLFIYFRCKMFYMGNLYCEEGNTTTHPPTHLHVYISIGCDCRVWRRVHRGAWCSLPFHGTTYCIKDGILVTQIIYAQAPPPPTHMRIDKICFMMHVIDQLCNEKRI
jgi:hypothetical protein